MYVLQLASTSKVLDFWEFRIYLDDILHTYLPKWYLLQLMWLIEGKWYRVVERIPNVRKRPQTSLKTDVQQEATRGDIESGLLLTSI